MAMGLTYTNHQESWLCMTLQTGDSLAAGAGQPVINGPALLYIPVDGSSAIYRQVVAAGVLGTAIHPARPPKPV